MTHTPRKRFGQHFLIDEQVISRIIEAISPLPGEHLVEIGAGHGALTTRVLNAVSPLHVIEIDRDLSRQLQEEYADKGLVVHEGDALKFDFNTLPHSNVPSWRVFGNLPYNISTPLLFHLLDYAECIQEMIFMLQKEVVDRMCASPSQSDYGRLSVMIQYACRVTSLFDIPPSAFFPPPKVMSSMVKLIPYHDKMPHPRATDYSHFANLVNVAFQHRRKTIKNALQDLVDVSALEGCGILSQQRPETLSVSQYVNLSNLTCFQKR